MQTAALVFVALVAVEHVWFAILDISNGQVLRASTTASCLLATSLVAALASIVHRQSRWRYFWIAWVGLALSLVLGYLSLVFRSMPGC